MVVHLVCQCGNEITVSESLADADVLCPRCGRVIHPTSGPVAEQHSFSAEETSLFSKSDDLNSEKKTPVPNSYPHTASSPAAHDADTKSILSKPDDADSDRTIVYRETGVKELSDEPDTKIKPETEDAAVVSEPPEAAGALQEPTPWENKDDEGDTPKTLLMGEQEVHAPNEDDFEFEIVDSEQVVSREDETKLDSSPKASVRGELRSGSVKGSRLKGSRDGSRRGSGTRHGSGSHISELDLTERVMGTISRSSLPLTTPVESSGYGVHRIIRTHQKGGMGRILIAYDQFLKRDIALKELHPEVAEDMSIVRRFIGEAEITAQLEHPGIVPIHMLGQDREGYPYYTMKLIKGHTLQEAIKAYHRNPSKAELMHLVRRLVSICKTIAFAHNKGVIHRDLKPANIMLGEHGETLVMDWGLAKPIEQLGDESHATIALQHRESEPRPELTMLGAIVGTPAFMSPEQASPEVFQVGPLSDVFSLGAILYYLLAGQTAFSGRSTQEVLSKVRAASPPKPSEFKPNVPRGLEAICAKAMAKNLEDRYESATELVDDLCRWLDDEPVRAQKENLLQKILRWIDHHRLLTVSIPFVLVLIIVLTTFGIYLDRTGRTKAEMEQVRAVLNDPIDLTDQDTVTFRGGPGILVRREPRLTGGNLIFCEVEFVPPSNQGVVEILTPGTTSWNLSQRSRIQFSINEPFAKGEGDILLLSHFFLRIGRGSAYYEYHPKPEWWAKRRLGNWFTFVVPLGESDLWTKTRSGDPLMTQVEWVEIHFNAESSGSFRIDNVVLLEAE